jgi:hypothetical protein
MTLTDTMPAPAVVSFAHLADLSLPFAPPVTSTLDDAALLSAQRSVAEIRRRVDATAAALAAEIEHRSRRELGHAGLAQRLGARTPERLVQQLTGSTSREASTMVRVGALMVSSAPPLSAAQLSAAQPSGSGSAAEPDPHPWLREVGCAVASGQLSLEAAEAIRGGLGVPDDEVSAESLAHAAATLLAEATTRTVEKLAARARDLRLGLDLDRVAEREQFLRSKRFLHLFLQPDGMTRLSGLLRVSVTPRFRPLLRPVWS